MPWKFFWQDIFSSVNSTVLEFLADIQEFRLCSQLCFSTAASFWTRPFPLYFIFWFMEWWAWPHLGEYWSFWMKTAREEIDVSPQRSKSLCYVLCGGCMCSIWQQDMTLINYPDVQSWCCSQYWRCPDVGLFFQDATCWNAIGGAFLLCGWLWQIEAQPRH